MTWDAAYYYCEALKARGDITSGLAGNNSNPPSDYTYWVNPDGSTPTSSNSCEAFGADVGYVFNDFPRDLSAYALCE